MLNHLVFDEPRQEMGQGSVIRIRRQDGVASPSLIDVFNNHKRLTDGSVVVKKNAF